MPGRPSATGDAPLAVGGHELELGRGQHVVAGERAGRVDRRRPVVPSAVCTRKILREAEVPPGSGVADARAVTDVGCFPPWEATRRG